MKIEVSLSPALYSHRTIKQQHVTVAVDLLRATTAVCAAFEAGCEAVLPLDTLEGMGHYRDEGYLLAAERGGCKVDIPMPDGNMVKADYGNSPTEYLRNDLGGVRLAYSTTNGTISIVRGADADLTLAGCFANRSALATRLRTEQMDVVVLCSGWQNDFCIEDTLVAGALIEELGIVAEAHGDAAQMAVALWQSAKYNPYDFCLHRCSHIARLHRLGADDDVRFAFRRDTCPVVPVLRNGQLTL